MTSHDLVKWAPSRLYGKRDGIGQTPCSNEHYLIITVVGDVPGTHLKGAVEDKAPLNACVASKIKLDGHGRARREAARRRKSEWKVNLGN